MIESESKAKSSDKYEFLEGMIQVGQEDLGRKILAAVEEVTWSTSPTPDPYFARTWTGTTTEGFRFVVADFEIESQGFPGQRGADGAVSVPDFGIVRLGHKLSEHCVELARKQNPNG